MNAVIRQIRGCLVHQNHSQILSLATHNKRILSYLTALTYDPQALIAWRAVSALGLAAGVIADRDPEYVRVHLRRLMWLLSDESGGIGWKAPEAMGEMIRSRPHLFNEFIPILIAVLDMEPEDVPSFRDRHIMGAGQAGSNRSRENITGRPSNLTLLARSRCPSSRAGAFVSFPD